MLDPFVSSGLYFCILHKILHTYLYVQLLYIERPQINLEAVYCRNSSRIKLSQREREREHLSNQFTSFQPVMRIDRLVATFQSLLKEHKSQGLCGESNIHKSEADSEVLTASAGS